jgi:hypothetical protein
MKNLFFSLAFMLIGSIGFANTIKSNEEISPIKSELAFTSYHSERTESRQITFINYENPNRKTIVGCADCGPQGCCILTVIKDDGTVRSTETCCKNIIVVKIPTITAE